MGLTEEDVVPKIDRKFMKSAFSLKNIWKIQILFVLVYKGKKMIVVTRRIAQNPLFLILFQRKYVK